MARKTPRTLETVEAEIASNLEKLTQERATYQALMKRISTLTNKLKKLEDERVTFAPLDLESALVAYKETGENTQGYEWLNERSWKGDWKDTGLRHNGSYWPETNQYVMSVWSNNTWDDAKLKEQAKVIMDVLPAIKAGIMKRETLIQISKGEKIDLNTMKVFDIFDRGASEYSSWMLAALEDGRWIIYDAYTCKYAWGQARKVGTLMECLKEMRDYLYYEGPRDDDDGDDY